MTDKVIKELPDIFIDNICTMKKASTDSTNKETMTESLIKVINFDKIPNIYAKGRGWKAVPKSNDALYKDINGRWYFIEFKNGSFKQNDMYRKIYDSLIMLIDMKMINTFEDIRNNFCYIFVYNDEKNNKAQKTESLGKIYASIQKNAQQEAKIMGIGNLEGYLFKETHTYSKEQFENKFIHLMENQETCS